MKETEIVIPINYSPKIMGGISLENILKGMSGNLAYQAEKFIMEQELTARALTITVRLHIEDEPCTAYGTTI